MVPFDTALMTRGRSRIGLEGNARFPIDHRAVRASRFFGQIDYREPLEAGG
jgi:hypothetical protein